jgi:hypothetical protein
VMPSSSPGRNALRWWTMRSRTAGREGAWVNSLWCLYLSVGVPTTGAMADGPGSIILCR